MESIHSVGIEEKLDQPTEVVLNVVFANETSATQFYRRMYRHPDQYNLLEQCGSIIWLEASRGQKNTFYHIYGRELAKKHIKVAEAPNIGYFDV